MIKIERLWSAADGQDNIILLNRPRISIKVDEYVWGMIEKNIVVPKKIMQSNLYDYYLFVALGKYSPETCRAFPFSPYNGSLKDTATLSTYKNPSKCYKCADFIGGVERTTWFSPEKFWTNEGNKFILVSAYTQNVSENMTPHQYADLLFDAFAATLLHNFKKLKKSEFDELKTHIEQDVICSFPFPAPFSEQKYQGDDNYFRITRLGSPPGVNDEIIIDIPNVEKFYKQHYNED